MSASADEGTRGRLLASAVRLFAAQGYAATSVRQVCDRAGANVAAVSYHFGSKRGLYDAAFDHARAQSNAGNRWVALDSGRDFWAGKPAEERLAQFIAMMLDHALDGQGGASDLSRMMVHEMLDPTPAFDRQVRVSIGRVFDALCAICRDIAGPGASERAIARLALLVSAQCLYQSLAASVLPLLHQGVGLDADGRAALADMITRTTLDALARLGGEGAKQAGG